ncbi:MAG TPA: hypothetical protein VI077_10790 [Pseudolabrys sp.]
MIWRSTLERSNGNPNHHVDLNGSTRQNFDAHKYFEVIGCHTGKRYRICHGNGASILELGDGALPRPGWCFVPSEHLVAADVMLAQKIALETDERGALTVANNFTPR